MYVYDIHWFETLAMNLAGSVSVSTYICKRDQVQSSRQLEILADLGNTLRRMDTWPDEVQLA